MNGLRPVAIAGTGMYVPPRVVTNHDLAKLMDTSDEWIQQRSGIVQRHHVDAGVGPAELAFEAAKKALDAAGLQASDIDYIIVASLSPQHDFPGISAFLQDKLDLAGCPAMDVRCQCTGFLYGLQMGRLLVASGQYKRVLLIGSEVHSTALDFSTRGRDVTVLFGDGAGAVILEPSDDAERGVLSVHTHAEGKYAKKLWIEAPGSFYGPRISHEMIDEGRHYPYMEGRFVFKHAVTRMPEAVREALEHNKTEIADVKLWLFHQANLRINEMVAAQLGIPTDRCPFNIDRYGNCSAASIPMLLDECVRGGRVQRGDLIAMTGFGSGFTWGSALVRW
jgi:3-oxoacyl-[acyl-carrier-protein] synthase III